MANVHNVRSGMQVIGSDGGMIGTVSGIEGDQIAVASAGEHAGHHHHVPSNWVARVDEHVHLDRPAAVAWDSWKAHHQDGGVTGRSAPGTQVRGEAATDRPARGSKWVWIIGAIMLLIIIVLGIRAFGYAAAEPDYENGVAAAESPDT